MEVKSITSCLNCENITSTFDCSKHNIEVDVDKVCSDHVFKQALTKIQIVLIVKTSIPKVVQILI